MKRIHKAVRFLGWIFLIMTIILFLGYIFRCNWVLFPGSCDPTYFKMQHEIIGRFAMACCSITILLKVICVQFDLNEIKETLYKND